MSFATLVGCGGSGGLGVKGLPPESATNLLSALGINVKALLLSRFMVDSLNTSNVHTSVPKITCFINANL